ncbi:hypothetical protein TST_0556 [Thermosulfidibacter takaii ABI70S6]|uniref:Flagellar assembly protein T N-terminal domain-containing protein n=1 Tax=Thermosulfidibacter takaii (strain DSM 17441 / JCM 13301 / NBRC 103674 / ABI70S6) TaxID=1298851 RepID=A0A0S3QSP3_THET7|nr:hypothetical protein [Thermosulfidibacter takaii]BAT71362.1 hypothetical protein TST_0556 [Thermosulfidibacter takaii ABI70S6]
MARLSKVILGIFVTLIIAGLAQAVTVEVIGSGPTRQAAINNALRAAIEQALGTEIQSSTRVNMGRLDYDRIITASAGYIQSYQVIAEGKDPVEGVYKVKLRVAVNDYKLKEDFFKEFKRNPRSQKIFVKSRLDSKRVVVLYSRRAHNSLPYNTMPVKEIIDRIEDKLAGYGFRVFLPEQIARIKNRATELAIDEETAIQIARQEDGDVVVLVDVQAGKRPTPDGFYLIYATVSLKAFDVTTGELFANVIKRGKTIARAGAYGIEEGAARAVAKVAPKAVDQLVQKIVTRLSTSHEKFLVFIFRDIPQDIQLQLQDLFANELGWDFRVARQYGSYMEVEVFSENDPTSANLQFYKAIKKAGIPLTQVEMKGSRIVYSGQ